MTLQKIKTCRICRGLSLDSSVCEDCEKENPEDLIVRKAQPTDPTVYVPDFDGIGALDD